MRSNQRADRAPPHVLGARAGVRGDSGSARAQGTLADRQGRFFARGCSARLRNVRPATRWPARSNRDGYLASSACVVGRRCCGPNRPSWCSLQIRRTVQGWDRGN